MSASGLALGPPAGGGGDSYLPILTADGRYVLFASTADNLVLFGTNRSIPASLPASLNVFSRDRTKGYTVLVSMNVDGTGGGNADSLPMGVSTNGRFALFESSASNLVPGDTNNASDVFVRDLVSGTSVLVSASKNGGFADAASYSSVVTPDGRYVAFVSAADNLVQGDTNGIPDVFVRDLATATTTLVSVGAQPGNGFYSDVGSDVPVITPDGRYVAFYSTATNLVPGTDGTGNIYVRDLVAGTTIWASSDALAAMQSVEPATNVISFNPAMSFDGRYIGFEAVVYPQLSRAIILRYDVQTAHTDLIETNAALSTGSGYESIQNLGMTPDGRFLAYAANTNDASGTATCIRVWDSQSGRSVLVSGSLSNTVQTGSSSDSPVIDDSGRLVAFLSSASDLVTNSVPGDEHLYVRDLQAGTTTLVDADTNGVGSPIDPVTAPAMSADGRFISFASLDGSLVPADRNRAYDVFVRDLANAATEMVSVRHPALPSFTPDGPSGISPLSVSSDARFVAFWSEADDLVANDTNAQRDVFFRDLLTGTNALVSVDTNGFAGDGESTDPAISVDGRYVAFTSLADNLVGGDNNHGQDVFLRDLLTGTTTLVSVNSAGTGPGNQDSFSTRLSDSGRFVLFHSGAGNLTLGMTAGTENLFLRDLQANRTFALTTNGVTSVDMTPDGRYVLLATSSSRIGPASDRLYLWDSQSGAVAFSLTGLGLGVGGVAISADAQRIAYFSSNLGTNQLQVVDLDGQHQCDCWFLHPGIEPGFALQRRRTFPGLGRLLEPVRPAYEPDLPL